MRSAGKKKLVNGKTFRREKQETAFHIFAGKYKNMLYDYSVPLDSGNSNRYTYTHYNIFYSEIVGIFAFRIFFI